MGQLEDRLKERIDDLYGSIPKFANHVNLPVSTIYTLLRRGINAGSVSTVLPILATLGIDSNWIIKNRLIEVGSDHSEFVDVPRVGAIAAGTPIEMVEVEDTHPVPAKVMERYPDAFLLTVEGDSMNRILPDGCYALIDPCDDVERDGQPCAVCVNGYDATIKRVRKLANGFELVPDSTDPTYKPTVYDYGEEGTERITVIGRVVYHVIPFDWSY